MNGNIVIVAALPREVAPLVRGWKRTEPAKHVFAWQSPPGARKPAVVVAAGVGPARAALAFTAALQLGSASQVVSAGLAGGLRRGVDCGRVYQPNEVIDARTGERWACAMGEGTLVTANAVAGIAEKKRLSETYSADVVDMEAATVARMAAQAGITFRCVKSVSDGYDFELPQLSKFVDADGQFHTPAFAAYVAVHPAMWGRLRTLARDSGLAVRNLCAELARQLG